MTEWMYEMATACWAEIAQMKAARFCYAGLFGLYLAEALGVHDRRAMGIGAAMYLALYLA